MSRRRLTLGAAVLGVLVLVASTGAGSGQARPDGALAPAASEVSGNLVLAHWASSPVETQLLQQVVASFERRYPQIKVRRRALNPYPESMLAQFAARRPPDVFYVDSNVAPDWIRQGVIEPLDSYIDRYNFRTRPFYPRLLSAFQSGGRTYGFPKDWSPLAMQTNNAMLARANVRPPRTWDELRTAAQRLRAANAVPGGRPICLSASWDRLLAFAYQNNGAFLSPDRRRAMVNSPQNNATANFYLGLIQSGLAGTPPQLGVEWCGEALGKEQAAIIFEGNWVIPFMAEQYPTVRYTSNPMVRNRSQGNLAFTVSYSIARDSKQKAAAWTLLTYLTGREGMRIWTSKGLALPSRSDVRPVPGRQVFLQAAPFARPWQFAPGFARVITVAGNELTAAIEGKQSIDVMLNKIQAAAQSALRRVR
jgi:multiple sugar transport system substrate-binding protein